MPEEVFISYGSADRGRIQDLVSRLRQAGVTVWIDEAGIEGAAMWSEEIVGAINHCKVLILAISSNSTKSKNVVRELALASEEEKTILPVFIEPTDIPESMKYQLAGIQRVEYFAGNEEEAIDSVLRALSRLGITTNDSEPGQALGQAPAVPTQAKRKSPALAIAAVAVIALLTAVFLLKPSGEQPVNKPSAPATKQETTATAPAKPLDKNRIVVLPFKNIGTAGENDHIVEGIVDDLNIMLTNVDGLKVIGSASAKSYKDTDKTPAEIGQELNTGTLLQGSIQKAGNQLKINVKLVDANTGELIWGKPFEGNETERFALQSQIVKSVGENLGGIAIDEARLANLKKSGTTNPEAYDLLQKARVELTRYTRESSQRAVAIYQEAIQADPNYADAYVGLADALGHQVGTSIEYPMDSFPKAITALEKALSINPNHAAALAKSSHFAMVFEWNVEKAKQLIAKANEINPLNTDVILHDVEMLMRTAKYEEAGDRIYDALKNDPKSSMLLMYLTGSYEARGMTDKADEYAIKALEISPHAQYPIHLRSIALSNRKQFAEAETMLKEAIAADDNNPVSVMSLGVVYWKQGKKEEALELLVELLNEAHFSYIKSDVLIRFYAAMGDEENALKWVKRAIGLKEPGVFYMSWGSLTDDFISSNRFRKLYKDAGIADLLPDKKTSSN